MGIGERREKGERRSEKREEGEGRGIEKRGERRIEKKVRERIEGEKTEEEEIRMRRKGSAGEERREKREEGERARGGRGRAKGSHSRPLETSPRTLSNTSKDLACFSSTQTGRIETECNRANADGTATVLVREHMHICRDGNAHIHLNKQTYSQSHMCMHEKERVSE